ncbi:hypothetical protein HBI56_110750 [Parastagonospora nodorum]|nr:hypothetical protein HBH49_061390 [Parastagonospora nodorum]KAH4165150.1 hypothetical protein HBH43_141040 [Parastagonospora nodorum]KAH4207519.1 hypothetical protein HBI95_105100 [Parastagonospora nodorum]KAH4302704.1 hypothetical protein HBI01_090630 [Parastagonospora nodorum]KAH4312162.1 hypothetical protein HBI02_088580 [Parastagonospora nodorum]
MDQDIQDEGAYYDPDLDAAPKSPQLRRVQPKAFSSRYDCPSPIPTAWDLDSRSWLPLDIDDIPVTNGFAHFAKSCSCCHPSVHATQLADTLLLHHMAPQYPQIARSIGTTLYRSIEFDEEPAEIHNGENLLPNPRVLGRGHSTLPLKFNGTICSATILACPDTGSDVNLISKDIAKALGYEMRESAAPGFYLLLADGTFVFPERYICAEFTFAVQSSTGLPHMSAIFYVLRHLPSQVIMGVSFLEQFQIMTLHRNKIMKIPRSTIRVPRVFSVGIPRKHLICEIDNELAAATPDSGSEIDLMSTSFATARGFNIYPAEELIELADGSIVTCQGFVRAKLSIATHFNTQQAPGTKADAMIDFFLLNGLTHDVILGEHYLEELKVYTKNQHALILVTDPGAVIRLNRIRKFGAVDSAITWLTDRLRSQQVVSTENGSTVDTITDQDQRENHRREKESHRIGLLPIREQEAARTVERVKEEQYGSSKHASSSLSSSQAPRQLGPDPAQSGGNLLDSRLNLHS